MGAKKRMGRKTAHSLQLSVLWQLQLPNSQKLLNTNLLANLELGRINIGVKLLNLLRSSIVLNSKVAKGIATLDSVVYSLAIVSSQQPSPPLQQVCCP